jgi:hypothetical protein
MPTEWVSLRFIGEEIRVDFDRPPALSRKPDAPNGFVWRGQTFRVAEILATWFEYERKGRMAKNMQEAHRRVAAHRGSWGVGRFTFRVRTQGGRVFDVYYDRAPEGADDREGHWFLYREMGPAEA